MDRKWTYKLLWSTIKRHSQERRSLQHQSQSLLSQIGCQSTQTIIYSWLGRSQSVRKAQEAHDFGSLWPRTESSSFSWWQTRSWPTSTNTVSASANQTTPSSVTLACSRQTCSASFPLQVQSCSSTSCEKTRKISWITSTSSIKLSIARRMQWSSTVPSTLQRKNSKELKQWSSSKATRVLMAWPSLSTRSATWIRSLQRLSPTTVFTSIQTWNSTVMVTSVWLIILQTVTTNKHSITSTNKSTWWVLTWANKGSSRHSS